MKSQRAARKAQDSKYGSTSLCKSDIFYIPLVSTFCPLQMQPNTQNSLLHAKHIRVVLRGQTNVSDPQTECLTVVFATGLFFDWEGDRTWTCYYIRALKLTATPVKHLISDGYLNLSRQTGVLALPGSEAQTEDARQANIRWKETLRRGEREGSGGRSGRPKQTEGDNKAKKGGSARQRKTVTMREVNWKHRRKTGVYRHIRGVLHVYSCTFI